MVSLRANYRRWKTLTGDQKRAFLRASVLLSVIGLGLRILPFSRFRKWYHRLASSSVSRETEAEELERVSWAVRTAAHHLPFTLLCLPQALTLKYMLRHEAGLNLHIGVQKDAVQGFMAHAWVEKDSRTIIGDLPEMNFQPLWIWN